MNASQKLRFEHGIWCLIFSYVFTIVFVASCFLMVTVNFTFGVLGFILPPSMVIILARSAIVNFKYAINISGKDMSYSRLPYEHGIWCTIFSHIDLIVLVSSFFLAKIVRPSFIFLAYFCFITSGILIFATINYFKEAIIISDE